MLLTYRLSQTLLSTSRAIRRAQNLRLGRATPTGRFRALGLLAANLLPRSLDAATRLARGLECRGYDGDITVAPLQRELSGRRLGLILGWQLTLLAVAIVWDGR
jgi:cobalt/nickel transport system permease protein